MTTSAFVSKECVHGFGRKRIAGDSIDRVGGHDDAVSRPQCLKGNRTPLFPRTRIFGIDDESAHDPQCSSGGGSKPGA